MTRRMIASCRNSDPETSYIAADLVEGSGRANSQRRLCFRTVIERPGQTAAEIASWTGLERHIPSRRLPELRDAGLVENGPARECKITGTKSMTWWRKKKEVKAEDTQEELF